MPLEGQVQPGDTFPPAEEGGRPRLLVCLPPAAVALELVRLAHRRAAALEADWFALTVETPGQADLPSEKQEALRQAFKWAAQLGGQVVQAAGVRVGPEILRFARENRITALLVGRSRRRGWRRLWRRPLADYLLRHSGVEVWVAPLPAGESKRSASPHVLPLSRRLLRESGLAAAGVGLTSAVAGLVSPWLSFTGVVLLYLLAVAVLSAVLSRGPALLAAGAAVAAADFLFVPEYWSFRIAYPDYALTLVVMLAVSLIISGLTARSRFQARVARLRERQAAAMYELGQKLSLAPDRETLLATAVAHLEEVFEARASVLLPGGDRELRLAAGPPLPEDVREAMVARWVYRHRHPAGAGTATLPAVKALYVPLGPPQQPVGVLRVELPDRGMAASEMLPLLQGLARQVGLALEREELSRQARAAQVEVEAERLRNLLLSSVSHDLKTPLTVIAGSASTLLENPGLDEATRTELAHTIYEEARRLDRLVHNLLEMSRLQSGRVELNRDWHDLEEVLGSALNQLEARLQGRALTLELDPDLPLVHLDALLIERVFINLLDNALKYSPEERPITLRAFRSNGEVVVEVADQGPGLPPGAEAKVFDKFYQAAPGSHRGVGLGLSICRSIVEIHGGRMEAANRPEGGAVFRFSLPLGENAPAHSQEMPPPQGIVP
ncbi:MAG: ATP-binding protein [Desulfobaccales bacterium]